MTRRGLLLALEIAVPLILLAMYAAWAGAKESFYFPPLDGIGERFVELWLSDRFVQDALPSLRRLAIGYVLLVVLGVSIGLVLGAFRLVQQAVQPFAEFLRALPAVALIPFGMLVFGVGDTMKIFIIVIGAIWPVLLNTIDGVRGVDPEMLEMARAYNVGRWGRIREIVVPAALPRVVTGMRTSLSIAIILMVVSEMVASRNGLGYFVLESQRRFAISDMWAGIVLLGIIGYVANFLFVRAERSVLRWHRESKGPAR
ncbi:MAG: ABC transporter permease subunit [Propionibacteriales bacterium]|nr:ABC transporter permease subunit [Propionibacteriales bacterium]